MFSKYKVGDGRGLIILYAMCGWGRGSSSKNVITKRPEVLGKSQLLLCKSDGVFRRAVPAQNEGGGAAAAAAASSIPSAAGGGGAGAQWWRGVKNPRSSATVNRLK